MNYNTFLHLFHILIVGPCLLYIGIMRSNMHKYIFNMLLFFGITIIMYHIYKAVININIGKSYWVNILHIMLIGPLLVYIGYYKGDVSRKFFEFILMLGFAGIGYHMYYLFTN